MHRRRSSWQRPRSRVRPLGALRLFRHGAAVPRAAAHVPAAAAGALQLRGSDLVQRLPGQGGAEGLAAAGALLVRARGDSGRLPAARARQRASQHGQVRRGRTRKLPHRGGYRQARGVSAAPEGPRGCGAAHVQTQKRRPVQGPRPPVLPRGRRQRAGGLRLDRAPGRGDAPH